MGPRLFNTSITEIELRPHETSTDLSHTGTLLRYGDISHLLAKDFISRVNVDEVDKKEVEDGNQKL